MRLSGVDGINGSKRKRPAPYVFSIEGMDSAGPGMQESFAAAKRAREALHYNAARASKYRHDVGGLGGTADAHYAYGLDYWRLRELVRELDRNNAYLGQLTDRGLDNILGAGLRVDPQTGDQAFDSEASAMFEAWAQDPNACDYSGRYTFDEMERLGLRHAWIDGDCFYLLDDRTGSLRFEEGDRVDSFQDATQDIVHGVLLDPHSSRPVAYRFSRLSPGQRKWQQINSMATSVETVDIPAQHVIHVYFPKRATQTRGITAYAPVIDQLYLVDDIDFARLVKLQVSACIAGFLYSDNPNQWKPGGTTNETSGYDDSTDLEFGEFTPGMIGRLKNGQKFDGFAPTVTTSEEGAFVESIIRRIGLAIGLPIEISLLTTKDTSFSGFRGVIEQYKITARVIQARYKRLLRSRVYAWKMRQWLTDGSLRPPRTVRDPLAHDVLTPTWAYIDPEKDARADALRVERNLASPRQVWAERGRDYDRGVRETAEDLARKVAALHEQAEALKSQGVEVTWRDLLHAGGDATFAASPAGANPAPAPDEEDAND